MDLVSACFLVLSVCSGLSDRDEWLELNDREEKHLLPDVKAVLNEDAGKAPPPVAGPHVGPAVDLDAVVDAVVEPRRPNIPILAKPPIKVSVMFVLIWPRLTIVPAKIYHVNYRHITYSHITNVDYILYLVIFHELFMVSHCSSSLFIHRTSHSQTRGVHRACRKMEIFQTQSLRKSKSKRWFRMKKERRRTKTRRLSGDLFGCCCFSQLYRRFCSC